MRKPIRVMLCDDSSTMRRLIKSTLQKDNRLEVVFEAQHGQEALDHFDRVKPDVLVIDVEMPVMDGIDTVQAIRSKNKRLPIVMFSSLTSRGAEATLDAMNAGANDFAVKPAGASDIAAAIKHLQSELVPKVIHLGSPKTTFASARQACSLSLAKGATGQKQSIDAKCLTKENETICVKNAKAIAIGVSTGGPEALATFFNHLPTSYNTPIVITQHMPKVFTRLLADRLTAQTGHQIAEAKDGDELIQGKKYLAPGDFHMKLVGAGGRTKIQLTQEPFENGCRPAVDPMFRSFATCFGHQAVGIVLTGMGQDGMKGSQSIKRSGGKVIVQDQTSSVIWGMPGKVVEAGAADAVLSLEAIAQTLAASSPTQPASGAATGLAVGARST